MELRSGMSTSNLNGWSFDEVANLGFLFFTNQRTGLRMSGRRALRSRRRSRSRALDSRTRNLR